MEKKVYFCAIKCDKLSDIFQKGKSGSIRGFYGRDMCFKKCR